MKLDGRLYDDVFVEWNPAEKHLMLVLSGPGGEVRISVPAQLAMLISFGLRDADLVELISTQAGNEMTASGLSLSDERTPLRDLMARNLDAGRKRVVELERRLEVRAAQAEVRTALEECLLGGFPSAPRRLV